MSAIEITRQDLSISQLRAEAARTADAKQARRILAIAMVLDGHSRMLAAQAGAMDRQTLRDWVHRYNADGLAGLADRPRPGRQPRLTEAQRSEVAKWVEDGPDLKTDGVVRWLSEVFLKASCASRSLCGCTGRTDMLLKFSLFSSLPTLRSCR